MNACLNTVSIEELVARHKPGYGLDSAFYRDERLFQIELDSVLQHQWLLVDHQSRIPKAGDYFLLEIAGQSLIIVRGKDGRIFGHHNVCRHRGSRVCWEPEGHLHTLTCPYHAWTYDFDGHLKSARLMPEGFDKSGFSLKPCHLKVHEGLIFVNIGQDEPPPFQELVEPLQPYLALHGLAEAKVACRETYPTAANWKLLIENFFECYHCAPAHPQLSSVHSRKKLLAYGAGSGSAMQSAIDDFREELDIWTKTAQELGHPTGTYADYEGVYFRSADRLPIRSGFLSETQDGKGAAPLMGRFKDYDGGQTCVSFNPLSTVLMSNDYATLFRFTPLTPTSSEMEVIWLVASDAEEGVNYDPERIKWMWHETTLQDKAIIEHNAAGILSRAYEPGPYSTQEGAVVKFMEWYLRQVGEG